MPPRSEPKTVTTRLGATLILPMVAEDAAINRGISADPDNPELAAAFFATARPAAEVVGPACVTAMEQRRVRGPQKRPTKALVSLRLDRDVLATLRASGPGWQGRANAILRKTLVG